MIVYPEMASFPDWARRISPDVLNTTVVNSALNVINSTLNNITVG